MLAIPIGLVSRIIFLGGDHPDGADPAAVHPRRFYWISRRSHACAVVKKTTTSSCVENAVAAGGVPYHAPYRLGRRCSSRSKWQHRDGDLVLKMLTKRTDKAPQHAPIPRLPRNGSYEDFARPR
jgi:hypothetical protein